MSTVELKDLRSLARALEELGRQIEVEISTSCLRAAQWGRGAATRATHSADAIAWTTYVRGWLSRKVSDGAIVANSAEHSYFVERGRKSGKAPPLAPISAWIVRKGIAPPPKPARISGVSGDAYGGKQRARLRKIKAERLSTAKSLAKHAAVYGMAMGIARKIARRGTRGRFILGKLVPRISAKMMQHVKVRLARLAQHPPR